MGKKISVNLMSSVELIRLAKKLANWQSKEHAAITLEIARRLEIQPNTPEVTEINEGAIVVINNLRYVRYQKDWYQITGTGQRLSLRHFVNYEMIKNTLDEKARG